MGNIGLSDEESELLVRRLIELVAIVDVDYLTRHANAPKCRDGSWRTPDPSGRPKSVDESWNDVGSVLKKGCASATDLSAWRCAEMILEGRCAFPVARKSVNGWKIGVAYPKIGAGADLVRAEPQKIRRRKERLRRRTEKRSFGLFVPGVEYETEWFS